MPLSRRTALLAAALVALAGCAEHARYPISAVTGPDPPIPPPSGGVIPTVSIAPATGWSAGATPVAAPGLAVNALAQGLDHPRWLHVLPNGDVLVAESNAPSSESGGGGLKAWAMKIVMKIAGAGVPSADRISLLRDADGDGVAELKTPFLENLHSPFGMALIGQHLYVANADALVRFPYTTGATSITAPGERVAELPAGRNHHWTKSLLAGPDGNVVYVGVGSNSNAAEHGMDVEQGRAAIWAIEVPSGRTRIYASGLRNPVGLAWGPSRQLWAVVNERDELGSDLVPDYLTSVREGAFYGWPYSYWGQHVDERVEPQRPELVARAVRPDFSLGNHVAPLGLASAERARLGPQFSAGMFVGLHGSWNRRPKAGYKVVFVPFSEGRPTQPVTDVLTGFLNDAGQAQGRPVGVAVDGRGALLVADDVGNTVWRVTAAR